MPITSKRSPLLILLCLPLTVGCVGELDPTTEPGTQDPGGKTDYDGDDGDGGGGGGSTTNPVPPSASATATVSDCGGHAATFSPDWEALSVIFDQNVVEPGRPIDCTVTLDYRFTAGWTFDLPHVDGRGYRFLEDGARVDVRIGASLGGAGGDIPQTWTGEHNDDWFLRFDGGGGTSVPCGATSARVVVHATAEAGGSGGSFAVIDSLDSEIDWRQCP